jgi:DNA repair photolyase
VKIREIFSKSILTKTAISGFDYCLNPYVGCGHGCLYCYASFIKRFTGHKEPWGYFVDVKINAPNLLFKQIKRATPGIVALSTITDPYQPLEKHYKLTRRCLEILLDYQFPINILTRSSLCLRDIDLFKKFNEIEVGVTITTNDDNIRRIFEPRSPSIQLRIDALKSLQQENIKTYAFIGPILPLDPLKLVEMLKGIVNEILIDRMNYTNRIKRVYEREGLNLYLEDRYFRLIGLELKERFEKSGIPVFMCF